MILAIDVGNTNIVIGCLDEKQKYFEARMSTDKNSTVEEFAIGIKNILSLYQIDTTKINGSIVSSVAMQMDLMISQAIQMVTGSRPLIIGPGVKTGLNIKIDNPAQLGSDLVVGAVASTAKYPLPQIVFDLGTATTASVIDKNGQYIGGMIAPGVKTALNALSSSTSQLPYIELTTPKKVIGKNTIDCMQSGSTYAIACMIDGIIERIQEELGEKATIIATGGIAKLITPICKHTIIFDDDLLLEGLLIIYNKNQQKQKGSSIC